MMLKVEFPTKPYMALMALAALLGLGALNLSNSTANSNTTRAAKPEVVRYLINADQSELIVRADRSGIFGFAGHDHVIAIRGFTGEATLTRDSIEPASLQLRIMADSLVVTDNVKEEDRLKIESDMREKVLETAKYPEIVFKSTEVTASKMDNGEYEVTIRGDLALHGVTRSVRIEAQMTLNGPTLRAQGEFSLGQKDYGIKPFSVAAGTVKVKNELKLSFDIVADQRSVD
jgi:polyisoprenoid-binding protein YceI